MCYPDVAEHLTSHPEIRHILFIGSKPVAHKVAESASKVVVLHALLTKGAYPSHFGTWWEGCGNCIE